jgi:hypothetical protein
MSFLDAAVENPKVGESSKNAASILPPVAVYRGASNLSLYEVL